MPGMAFALASKLRKYWHTWGSEKVGDRLSWRIKFRDPPFDSSGQDGFGEIRRPLFRECRNRKNVPGPGLKRGPRRFRFGPAPLPGDQRDRHPVIREDGVQHANRSDGGDQQQFRSVVDFFASAIVLVLGVVMAMMMYVPGAVSMPVFVLVEDDFEMPAERVGDTAERFQAGDMIAAFQTRNHRLGHP
jgi:hypothetical protein